MLPSHSNRKLWIYCLEHTNITAFVTFDYLCYQVKKVPPMLSGKSYWFSNNIPINLTEIDVRLFIRVNLKAFSMYKLSNESNLRTETETETVNKSEKNGLEWPYGWLYNLRTNYKLDAINFITFMNRIETVWKSRFNYIILLQLARILIWFRVCVSFTLLSTAQIWLFKTDVNARYHRSC